MIGIPNFMGIRFSGGPLGPQYLLYMVGRNHRGQLGVGDTRNRSFLTQVGSAKDWSKVNQGRYFTLARKSNGTLWSWGSNGYGHLGLSNTAYRSIPTQIGTNTDWSKISIGSYHCAAIKSDGTLWTWGKNTEGQLGISTATNRSSPIQVGTDTNWDMVSCGDVHTLARKSTGSIWSWGSNAFGQLGLRDAGAFTRRSSPVQIGSDTDWNGIVAGSYTSFGIKNNGTLWAWGSNGNGQFGNGTLTNTSSPVQVFSDTDWSTYLLFTTRFNCFRIKPNRTLWAWGANYYGVQGRGNTTNTSSPVQVGSDSNWAKVSCNRFSTFGMKYLSGITGVTSGPLYAWGNNTFSQLGIGATVYRTSPIQIGSGPTGDWGIPCAAWQASLVLKGNTGSSGSYLWAWGRNTALYSRWPLPTGSAGMFQSPFAVDSNKNWANVDANYGHGLARKTNNTIWSWGRNANGLLGLGDTTGRSTATQIGANTDWADIKAGGFHSVALKIDGTLWVWGENFGSKQLGGATSSTSVSSPIQLGSDTDWAKISAGDYHTLAIKTNGTLWGWGNNTYGELGIGNLTTPNSPVQVGSGTTGPWVNIATGRRFSLAVQNNGTLWAWGRNNEGNLGIGTASGARQSVPIQVGAMTDWDKVDCGRYHSVAIKSNKTLWTWGLGLSGQLGNGTLTNASSPIQIGSDTWLYASAGRFHTLGTRTDGTLWGWGGRNSGVLAMDDGGSYSSPVQVGSLTGWSISSINNNPNTRYAMGIVLRKS